MHCHLRGGQGKDEPSTTGVDRVEAEHSRQEGAIGFCVVAEQHKMGSEDHASIMAAVDLTVTAVSQFAGLEDPYVQ